MQSKTDDLNLFYLEDTSDKILLILQEKKKRKQEFQFEQPKSKSYDVEQFVKWRGTLYNKYKNGDFTVLFVCFIY